MDRLSPKLDRQKSFESPTGTLVGVSPLNRHARSSSSASNLKKPQNVATKAAAHRLARVMAQGGDDEDEDEDDLIIDYNPTSSLGLAGRSARPASRSPNEPVGPVATEQPISMHTPMVARPSFSSKSNDQQSSRPSPMHRLSPLPVFSQEQTESPASVVPTGRSPMASLGHTETVEAQSMLSGRLSLSVRTEGSSSARSNSGFRQSLSMTPNEQSPLARSAAAGRSPLAMPISSSEGNLASRNSLPFGSAEQPQLVLHHLAARQQQKQFP